MSYSCKILLDSISETGKRITTFELTYPRLIHSEFMTHRMFSRNAASSRAIPAKRMREMVLNETFIPDKFPKNVTGMQPAEWIEKGTRKYEEAEYEWLLAAKAAVASHKELELLGIHKQICNRLLEPFLWYTCIVTATEFDNFFKLRCDENAQYEIRRIADLMYEAYHYFVETDSKGLKERNYLEPQKLKVGEWHCPLVSKEDDEQISKQIAKELGSYNTSNENLKTYIEIKKKISVARCARISYLTHDGKRDIEKDLELFERLRTSGHYSPFEHVATPSFNKLSNEFAEKDEFENLRNGNFIGWRQMRQDLPNENCISFRKEN